MFVNGGRSSAIYLHCGDNGCESILLGMDPDRIPLPDKSANATSMRLVGKHRESREFDDI